MDVRYQVHYLHRFAVDKNLRSEKIFQSLHSINPALSTIDIYDSRNWQLFYCDDVWCFSLFVAKYTCTFKESGAPLRALHVYIRTSNWSFPCYNCTRAKNGSKCTRIIPPHRVLKMLNMLKKLLFIHRSSPIPNSWVLHEFNQPMQLNMQWSELGGFLRVYDFTLRRNSSLYYVSSSQQAIELHWKKKWSRNGSTVEPFSCP